MVNQNPAWLTSDGLTVRPKQKWSIDQPESLTASVTPLKPMVVELQGDAVFGHGPHGVGIESFGQGGVEVNADADLDSELAGEVLDDFFGDLGHLGREFGRADGHRTMEGGRLPGRLRDAVPALAAYAAVG